MSLKEKKTKHLENLLQIGPWTFKTYLTVSSASDGTAQIREGTEQTRRTSERRYVGR